MFIGFIGYLYILILCCIVVISNVYVLTFSLFISTLPYLLAPYNVAVSFFLLVFSFFYISLPLRVWYFYFRQRTYSRSRPEADVLHLIQFLLIFLDLPNVIF
jgi:hypothetical protein